jgi:putative ABC transport system substrate-binding protein
MRDARLATRRIAPLLVIAPLVAAPVSVRAAEVAVLKSADVAAWRPALDALHRAASTHSITEYDLKGAREEAAPVLEALRPKAKDTIFVAMGPLAAEVARETFPQSRLIFCMIQDPGKLGLLTAPGVTGVAFSVPIRNQLAAFRLVNPAGVRVGVIYTGVESGPFFSEAKVAAATVRLALVGRPITSEKDVPGALRTLLTGSNPVDALWIQADASLLGDDTRRFLISETLKAGRPVYAFSDALISEGALVSDGPSFTSIGEEVGDLVNRVAGGEKGRIDMLMPRAELVVNKKIAGKLKVEIPDDALQAAGRVY